MSTTPERAASETTVPSPEVATRPTAGLQPLLTAGEVAALLRLSGKTIQRLVASRRLPCVRIGRRVRFTVADVFRFVAARKD
jgi:excisionase family DNA binding protein